MGTFQEAGENSRLNKMVWRWELGKTPIVLLAISFENWPTN